MADIKISQLTEHKPVVGTDVFPVSYISEQGSYKSGKVTAQSIFDYVERTLDIDTADKLDADLTVTGVTVGNLTNGTKLNNGTSVVEILKQMLSKTINPKVSSNPSVSLTLKDSANKTVANKTVYEVGTLLSLTLTASFSDGKFGSTDTNAWSYTSSAGCAATGFSFKRGTTEVGTSTGCTDSFTVPENSTNYKVTCTYSGSTIVPVNNLNQEVDSIKINGGSVTSGTTEIIGRYKYYMSEIPFGVEITNESIKNYVIASDFINNTFTIDSVEFPNGGQLVIALPSGKAELTEIMNKFNSSSLLAAFKLQSSPVELNIGGESKFNYVIYKSEMASTENVYKNIKITKK